MLAIARALSLFLALSWPATAGTLNLLGAGKGAPGTAYTGPGDVVASASAWYGLRPYTLAYSGNVADICDVATGVTCATITAAAGVLTIPTISGSNCNGGIACNVSKLYDQTAANNCTAATCDVSQATNGNRPALSFSCAGITAGLPCMTFNGTSQSLASANALSSVAQPNTHVSVCERTGNFTTQGFCLAIGANVTLLGFTASTNTVEIGCLTALTATAADSSPHSFQGICNGGGTASSVTVDGSTTTGATGSNAASGTIRIGTTSGNLRLTGNLTEAGLWSGAFSAGNLSAMNSNQRAYWGF